MELIKSKSKIKYFVLFLLSSIVISGIFTGKMESGELGLERLTFTFLNLFLIFSLHLVIFSLLTKTISELWSAALSLLSLSVYDGFPFRDFLWFFFSPIEIPTDLSHPIFNDVYTTTSAILSVLVILISISRSYSLIFRASTSGFLLVMIIPLSLVDAIFLSLFYAVYWPVKFKLKNKLSTGILTFLFGICVAFFGLYFLSSKECDFNCLQPVSLYYFIVYLLLPLVLMLFVYLTHRVDPYELFIRFRTVFALLILELVFMTLIKNGLFFDTLSVPNFVLGQTLLHILYYTPIIYYAGREDIFIISGKSQFTIYSKLRSMFAYIFYTKHSEILCSLILLFFLYNLISNR